MQSIFHLTTKMYHRLTPATTVPATTVPGLAFCLSDPDDYKCNMTRAKFLDDTLTSLGITHRVSATLADFKQAFRSGQYNLYWLSGGALKLDNGLAQEIREAVNRGDGLLLDGIHDERNGLLDEVAGVRYRGKLSTSNQPITLTGSLFTPGASVPTLGRPLRLALDGGTQQARFPAGLKCDDCDDKNDKNGATPGDTPAIVSNAYGKGRGIVMAFDLTGTLTQAQPLSPVWQDIMQAGFGYLAPQTPDPLAPEVLSAGAYAVARTTLTNQGQAVALDVTGLLPPGAFVLSATPRATVDANNSQAKWSLNLAVAQSTDLTLALRVPQSSGSHTLTTTVDSLLNGQSKRYGSYPLVLNVASAMELAVTNQLIADLKALAFTSSRDREARDQTVKALQDALTRTAQGKYDDALGNLLDAVDKLRRITSRDMSAYRLAVDRWLQELELQWLNMQPSGKH